MPRITIADGLSVELLSANPKAASGLAKYLKNPAAALRAGAELRAELEKQLQLVSTSVGGFGLEWVRDVPFEVRGAPVTVTAGSGVHLLVYNQPGMSLVDEAFVGPPMTVRPGQAFVAFSIQP